MLAKVFVAWLVMAACVSIHAGGLTTALRWIRTWRMTDSFWRMSWAFATIAGWMILLHVTEIVAWAIVYHRGAAMPTLAAALYFSAVTYTTTGYGDLVLPEQWRLVGAIEALTGILMCGLSTGFFFAAASRLYQSRSSGA